ncbi:hypothetical protein ACWGHA_39625 [Streptomyces xanthophaeus]
MSRDAEVIVLARGAEAVMEPLTRRVPFSTYKFGVLDRTDRPAR